MTTKLSALECPACGSTELVAKETRLTQQAPFGPSVDYTVAEYTCQTCGESGDFALTNDQRAIQARDESTTRSLVIMLDALAQEGLSNAYLERALELPSRTIARWKNGEHSAAGVTLLRFVRTFPWLLKVSENNYQRHIANGAVCVAAGRVLADAVGQVFVHPMFTGLEVQVKISARTSQNYHSEGLALVPASPFQALSAHTVTLTPDSSRTPIPPRAEGRAS